MSIPAIYQEKYDKRCGLIIDIIQNFNRPSLWLVNGILSILNSFSIELLEVIKEEMYKIRAIYQPLEQFKVLLSFIEKRVEAGGKKE